MATQQMSAAQANAMATASLLATGLRTVNQKPAISLTPNSTYVQTLTLTGIHTGARIRCTATLSNSTSGAIALTQSPYGPYNIINNIQYQDFAGTVRTNTHPAFLNLVTSMKQRAPVNTAASSLSNPNLTIYENPTSVPANGTATVTFELPLPFSYSETNLTGCIPAQVATGQHSINFQLGNWFGTDPWLSPFVASGTPAGITVSALSVTTYEEYIQPQSLQQIPQLSAATMYGIQGNLSYNKNLIQNQEVLLDYQVARSILSTGFSFNNGNTFNPGTDISQIRKVIGATQYPFTATPGYVLQKMRRDILADSPQGLYYLGSRSQPIDTTMTGQVQIGVTPTTVNSGAYIPYFMEFTAPLNTPLPGMIQ